VNRAARSGQLRCPNQEEGTLDPETSLEVRKDIADVTELITVNHLSRDPALGNELLQRHYEKIFDRKLSV
jgi:hypothetical protein